MTLLSRLTILAVLGPALAGCAVADLAAHAVKEYDKSRDPKPQVHPAAAPAQQAPAYQPAVARPEVEADPPVTLPAPTAPKRESISVEPLR